MEFSFHFLAKHGVFHIFIILIISIPYAIACYSSIFGFGDSLTDTGNTLYLPPLPGQAPDCVLPPYGETYFHNTTGRCCDGRLIIDFIAQHYGLPLIPPYFGVRNSSGVAALEKGVNFAVIGAPTLDDSFFEERGIPNAYKNVSLRIQLSWFKDLLPSLCFTSSNRKKLLQSSLFILNFGGNDYIGTLTAGRSEQEVRSYVPLVVKAISSAIIELIELEVGTIMVQGTFPFGCLSYFLTYFESSDKEEYDPSGCLIWLNKLAEYHNELLQLELNQIRELYPHAVVIYADLYHAALPFFISPTKFGFAEHCLTACCGAGGPPYHIITNVSCGYPPSCAFDPSFLYVNWDGFHLTEAAYRLITKDLLEGPYTIPPINTLCLSTVVRHKYSNFY